MYFYDGMVLFKSGDRDNHVNPGTLTSFCQLGTLIGVLQHPSKSSKLSEVSDPGLNVHKIILLLFCTSKKFLLPVEGFVRPCMYYCIVKFHEYKWNVISHAPDSKFPIFVKSSGM